MNGETERKTTGQSCVAAMRMLRERYLDKVRELERNRKPAEGIFGLKGGPADDPCHEQYADELASLLEAFLAEGPDSGSTRRVLEELYAPPPKNDVPRSAYWMLIAVQGLCPELIEQLDTGDARELEERFSASYRRRERMPNQQKILKALKNRAK